MTIYLKLLHISVLNKEFCLKSFRKLERFLDLDKDLIKESNEAKEFDHTFDI